MKEYMAVKANNNRADRGKNRKAGNSPKVTEAVKREELAKSLGLKPRSKAFLDLLLEDPTLSQTEAYIRTHETNDRATARARASEIATKSSAMIYKDSAVGKAKRRIVQLVNSDNESIALKASQDIIDRTSGKAVQKQDITSRTVEVKLDLSGVRIGAHYIPPAVPVPTLPE
jgi:predicted ATPase